MSFDLTGGHDQSQLSEATKQLVQAAAVLGAIITQLEAALPDRDSGLAHEILI